MQRIEKYPHPNPPETSDRPEGEGTDRGMLASYADLILLCRIHNRLGLSGRRTSSDTSVGPLPERGGTDCGMLQKYINLKCFAESIVDAVFQVDVTRNTPRSAPSPGGRGLG
ncbi:hypothetical protein CCX46_04685 [Pseudomonas sp. RU47]|nr:hypothetical protein CCX46_04685 [Pseudomonas sp. RU47]